MYKKEARYNLFRLQTETEGGASASPPEGFRDKFENNDLVKLAGGFAGFAKRWDINDQLEVIVLEDSVWQTWDKHCRSVAKDLPKKVDNVIRKERNQEADLSMEITAVMRNGG